MSTQIAIPSQLINQFCCPKCFATPEDGFVFADLICNRCVTDFFTLGDVPCFFPAGFHQKTIWQHQTAMLLGNAAQGLNNIRESLARYDLSDTTRERLAEIYKANLINRDSIQSLLGKKSLIPEHNEQLSNMNPGDLGEYFDLIFRDWAWDSVSSPSNENQNAFLRIKSLLDKLIAKPKRILVLGAGAGRLSWDLHNYLKPEFTLAVDSNPLLLAAADELIRQQQPLQFGEFKLFPQADFPITQTQAITAPENAVSNADNWFLLGANVWNLPLLKNNFDLILTPWFIDVNGGDVRDLIGIIHNLLTPEGSWLNTGPLLFTRHIPLQLKYSHAEIKEFIELTNMELLEERIEQAQYLISPLEARFREEQVWSFIATNTKTNKSISTPGILAPWLIMHHLPIPHMQFPVVQPHPLIEAIVAMIDGEKSVNSISAILSPQLPPGTAVTEVVVSILGQLILDQQNQPRR
jgi:hypothetical protein